MRCTLTAMLLPLLAALFVPSLAAQNLCPADEMAVATSADTVYVTHWNAERNCCLELAMEFSADPSTIDFFEGSMGESCRCDCCFDLHYYACGFPNGHYTVRLWNGDGTELYGSSEIDLQGDSSSPRLLGSNRGPCVGPSPVRRATWCLMKRMFR